MAGAISGIMRQLTGRGPERIRVYVEDEHVFVVLEGALSTIEETLVESDPETVRKLRVRLDELEVGPMLSRAVEEILRVRVVDFTSQVMLRTKRFVEVFVIDRTAA